VSVPGHYTGTFDDPLFRLLLLRGNPGDAGRSQAVEVPVQVVHL